MFHVIISILSWISVQFTWTATWYIHNINGLSGMNIFLNMLYIMSLVIPLCYVYYSIKIYLVEI